MKKSLSLLFVFLIPTYVFATKSACHLKSEFAVSSYVKGQGYDKNGFNTYSCKKTPNYAAVACDVAASKGHGAAVDAYRVILNKKCNHVFRVYLLSEE